MPQAMPPADPDLASIDYDTPERRLGYYVGDRSAGNPTANELLHTALVPQRAVRHLR